MSEKGGGGHNPPPLFSRLHLQAAPASNMDIPLRLRSVIDVFTANLHNNICRSLFEKDKLLFALLMTLRILESEGLVPDADIRFFLTESTALELPKPNPATAARARAAAAAAGGGAPTSPRQGVPALSLGTAAALSQPGGADE